MQNFTPIGDVPEVGICNRTEKNIASNIPSTNVWRVITVAVGRFADDFRLRIPLPASFIVLVDLITATVVRHRNIKQEPIQELTLYVHIKTAE